MGWKVWEAAKVMGSKSVDQKPQYLRPLFLLLSCPGPLESEQKGVG